MCTCAAPQIMMIDSIVYLALHESEFKAFRWSRVLRPLIYVNFSDFRQVCLIGSTSTPTPTTPRMSAVPLLIHPNHHRLTVLVYVVLFPGILQVRRGFRSMRKTLMGVLNVVILLLLHIGLFALLFVKLFENKYVHNPIAWSSRSHRLFLL